MANNLFPLLFHAICKQVLPHPALGARHFSHLTLHLSSYFAKLPLVPGCHLPPCGAKAWWTISPSSRKLPKHRQNADPGEEQQYTAGSSGLVLCCEACAALCTRGCGSGRQLSSLPTSTKGAVISQGVGRSPPLHILRAPTFHLPRGVTSLLQTREHHCMSLMPRTGTDMTDKCKAFSTPGKAHSTSG